MESITRIILNNQASLRAEPALQPWTWKWGDPINNKVKQLLAKLCKDYEVDFNLICPGRGPNKREAGSAEDGEDKKPMTSPKKPRPSPVKKAVKKEIIVSNSTDANEDETGVTDEHFVKEGSPFTPSPSPTPRKNVSGSSSIKRPTTMITAPKKIKGEPVTPVKSVAQEIAKDAQTPSSSPEDQMDVDEDEDEEPPVKQTRRKKRVISDDYSPSRSVTPAPTSVSGSASDALCFSPDRPKRGCAKQKNYNLALTYDGLDEYLKEKEGIEGDSDEEGESSEGDGEENEAADDTAESEEEDDVNATDGQGQQ